MVVYIEYAFAENFIMDLLLLYLSLKCARSRISWLRMIFAAAIGGVEAILFPVIAMPVWCAYFVKFLGGVLIVMVAVSEKKRKPYLKTIAIFFLSTFALGGLLTAVYSFFGIEYAEGRRVHSGAHPDCAIVRCERLVCGMHASAWKIVRKKSIDRKKYLCGYDRKKRKYRSWKLLYGQRKSFTVS